MKIIQLWPKTHRGSEPYGHYSFNGNLAEIIKAPNYCLASQRIYLDLHQQFGSPLKKFS
jgi:hypothetical protein